MNSHRPTSEQEAVIAAFRVGSTLVVEAGAGCGKSTTLKMAARTRPSAKGIYVAYNRALVDEAKRSFPSSTWCKTAHGLAFGPVGKRFAHRLSGPRKPAREVARILKITEPVKVSDTMPLVAPQQLARLVTAAVDRFCKSADPEPDRWHVARINGVQDSEMRVIRDVVVPLAREAWADLCSTTGELPYTHNCYLKLYQLSDPQLRCDYLLLDEAQDANPVMASIFEQQTDVQRVMVGDASQAINGWNGAVDAMSKFAADARLTLSQSFRFGPAIADEANKWLEILDAPLRLRGFEQIGSTIGPLAAPAAILCRTNAETVSQVMAAAKAGRRAALVGGGADIRRLAEAAIDLKNGRGTDHPELFMFSSWLEVQDYAEHDTSGSDLRVFVRLIDSHGADVVIDTVDRLVDESRADVVVSTAHKAKGREWPTVRVADDFREPKATEDDPEPEIVREDAMLAYVTVTRGQEYLDRGGLAWVDRWVRSGVRPAFDASKSTIGELIDASSLGTPEATAHREAGRQALSADLTGMLEEQADWDATGVDGAARAVELPAPHCHRCGSGDNCACDPQKAAEFTQRTGKPAGPAAQREAFLRNLAEGRDVVESLARALVGIDA
ncbi:UvrD-helicase domain-containing protein [Phytohabitans houttuyneae]|uniref:DNA helicase n=1 Tax=Phytohabitans houttuyneae TaxID=1076126 RepID=A0A6V8K707_9ACTN|nr:UvrD-helicase domain-containing protein [Phytohabitans houttuyneae]GFJ79544.1 DNA helicase [Phytohabitans houttuyneae]